MSSSSESEDEKQPVKLDYYSEEECNPMEVKGKLQRNVSTMEWYFNGLTNGVEQVVPCPFVSNDLAQLSNVRNVKMVDDKGQMMVRSIHEKDHPDDPDDIIIGRWRSGTSGRVIEVRQWEWNKLGLDYTIVAYGKRRTGKTHILKALSFQLRRYFPTVIVFTKTAFNGELRKMYPEAYIFDEMDEGRLMTIIEAQKAAVKEVKKQPQPWPNRRLLLIFDDVLSDDHGPRYNKKMHKMFFEGRHYWISFFVTSQDSKGLPPGLKQNTDLTFILPIQARRDRETVSDNSLPFIINDRDSREFNEKLMQFKHNFLAIVNSRGGRPMAEQVYLGIIPPLEFIPRFVMGSYYCWEKDLDQLGELEFDYLKDDVSLEAWGIEPYMPVEEPSKKRPDGMSMVPAELKVKKKIIKKTEKKIKKLDKPTTSTGPLDAKVQVTIKKSPFR